MPRSWEWGNDVPQQYLPIANFLVSRRIRRARAPLPGRQRRYRIDRCNSPRGDEARQHFHHRQNGHHRTEDVLGGGLDSELGHHHERTLLTGRAEKEGLPGLHFLALQEALKNLLKSVANGSPKPSASSVYSSIFFVREPEPIRMKRSA